MSASSSNPSTWLDFDDIKKRASFPWLLTHFGLLEALKQHGNKLTGWCPLGTKGHGKKDSFNVDLDKQRFQCFACKSKGSVIDFVAKYQGVHLRDAGSAIVELLDATQDHPTASVEDESLAPDQEQGSGASDQTSADAELGEAGEDILCSSPAYNPATVSPAENTMPGASTGKVIYSFDDASLAVSSNQLAKDSIVVVDKDWLSDFIRLSDAARNALS